MGSQEKEGMTLRAGRESAPGPFKGAGTGWTWEFWRPGVEETRSSGGHQNSDDALEFVYGPAAFNALGNALDL
jgi:hypothetical protein